MNNPVIGSAPCDHVGCGETVTVHEVKRGGSSRKGQLYTRCPGCGCDQTSGARRQQWLIDNTTPRAEYKDLFKFKVKTDSSAVSDDFNESVTETEKAEKPDSSAVSSEAADKKPPVFVMGIVGLVVVSGLALIGLKK